MATDPIALSHQEWLGYVQPVGLVVSIPALVQAQAVINRNFGPSHRRFLQALAVDAKGEPVPYFGDFPTFAESALQWDLRDLYGSAVASPIPDSLSADLLDFGEILRPTYALRNTDPGNREAQPDSPEQIGDWILLVEELDRGTNFDEVKSDEQHRWHATPQARHERLLRETGVPIGLLTNNEEIRLVYAPKGESSGHITFRISDMIEVAGRTIWAAMDLLLGFDRLFSVAEAQRLPAILADSRRFQATVSTRLAEQVLEALYELLRGLQSADDQTNGELLRSLLKRDPNEVYAGLVTVLLRLVFLLYAEDHALLSDHPAFTNHYSLGGLYERLREDHGRHPDTMDQRYGAWAHLLALFRLIYTGGTHGSFRLPAREGYLFDPARYPFLAGGTADGQDLGIPRVPDGVIYRVLSKLLILDGERLSYRSLAVEQLGSVYEAIIGFELQVAAGVSIAIRPKKRKGAPITISLEDMLAAAPGKRAEWFYQSTDQKLTGRAADLLKAASTTSDLLVTLDRKIARGVTPSPVPKGSMIFQPSDERRKSGSHYTPRSLTHPIVREALAPVLRQLGDNPTPDQILGLTICDPAMGSGAFLVEACRQLGDELARAWQRHKQTPSIPPDEDELLHARRLVAQRCLYGVDRNPLAADLAKLSLWLATLAKDHPFTFLDHALRTGDSLVGMTRRQITGFHWAPQSQKTFLDEVVRKRVERASAVRSRILGSRDAIPYNNLSAYLSRAEEALYWPRLAGDALVAAFFSAEKPRNREVARLRQAQEFEQAARQPERLELADQIVAQVQDLAKRLKGIAPFHWEIEFPEVFKIDAKGHVTGGFDVIVGNPPFAGKNTLIDGNAVGYLDWLKMVHEESHGNADVVAHFFRRAFSLLRPHGCMGLIATNTIRQGDTRFTGLRWICIHGGTIYRATKRLKWPGEAAVVVSVVHVRKGNVSGPYFLDGQLVPIITAYLFHDGGHENPARLRVNEKTCFEGVKIYGPGFTFDDLNEHNQTSTITEMMQLLSSNPKNGERIFPYIGGEEINSSPTQAPHRYVIDFEDFPLQRKVVGHSWSKLDSAARHRQLREGLVAPDYPFPVAADWPDLIAIIKDRVRPTRLTDKRENYRRLWWQFGERRPGLMRSLKSVMRAYALSALSSHLAIVALKPGIVPANTLDVVTQGGWSIFATLQSRIHEVWARFFGSSLEDRLRYTPSDCFETFPFPPDLDGNTELGSNGQHYYEFRAELLQRHNVGLTTLYNRFHDPESDCREVPELRKLHAEMDRAVLEAYGWNDITTVCDFFPEFDDEDEEDEDDGNERRRSRKKTNRKKYRYRWPEEIHDEVLARLLKLNQERALTEGQLIVVPADEEGKAATSSKRKGRLRKAAQPAELPLLMAMMTPPEPEQEES